MTKFSQKDADFAGGWIWIPNGRTSHAKPPSRKGKKLSRWMGLFFPGNFVADKIDEGSSCGKFLPL